MQTKVPKTLCCVMDGVQCIHGPFYFYLILCFKGGLSGMLDLPVGIADEGERGFYFWASANECQ